MKKLQIISAIYLDSGLAPGRLLRQAGDAFNLGLCCRVLQICNRPAEANAYIKRFHKQNVEDPFYEWLEHDVKDGRFIYRDLRDGSYLQLQIEAVKINVKVDFSVTGGNL